MRAMTKSRLAMVGMVLALIVENRLCNGFCNMVFVSLADSVVLMLKICGLASMPKTELWFNWITL